MQRRLCYVRRIDLEELPQRCSGVASSEPICTKSHKFSALRYVGSNAFGDGPHIVARSNDWAAAFLQLGL